MDDGITGSFLLWSKASTATSPPKHQQFGAQRSRPVQPENPQEACGQRNYTTYSPAFEDLEFEPEGSTKYVSRINARSLLQSARKELAEADPETWKMILLALGAG